MGQQIDLSVSRLQKTLIWLFFSFKVIIHNTKFGDFFGQGIYPTFFTVLYKKVPIL